MIASLYVIVFMGGSTKSRSNRRRCRSMCCRSFSRSTARRSACLVLFAPASVLTTRSADWRKTSTRVQAYPLLNWAGAGCTVVVNGPQLRSVDLGHRLRGVTLSLVQELPGGTPARRSSLSGSNATGSAASIPPSVPRRSASTPSRRRTSRTEAHANSPLCRPSISPPPSAFRLGAPPGVGARNEPWAGRWAEGEWIVRSDGNGHGGRTRQRIGLRRSVHDLAATLTATITTHRPCRAITPNTLGA